MLKPHSITVNLPVCVYPQKKRGTCALFSLTFSCHALHSHLLVQIFIIINDIPKVKVKVK